MFHSLCSLAVPLQVGYQLAVNASFLAHAPAGSSTLELLTQLKVGGKSVPARDREVCVP